MDRAFSFEIRDPNGIIPTSPEDSRRGLETLRIVQKGRDCDRPTLGWHRVEEWAGERWLETCERAAAPIRQTADAFVVIGIGGSNQAARAVAGGMGPREGAPGLFWAGNSISAHSVNQVLERLSGKQDVYINVLAKNFETIEPGIGFRALRGFLRERYGEGWRKRVIATGTVGSHMEAMSREEGFLFLPYPDDVGGRFTALTPVGLFPLAAAGYDIRALALGAADMERRLKRDGSPDNPALRYALPRSALYRAGYRVEMLSFFEPRFFRFAKWWVQIFGESEGKDGKGIFPAIGNYSEDLHSIGQFVQDGTRCLFETFLHITCPEYSRPLPGDGVDDRFGYLDGMDFDAINRAAFEGTVEAHSQVLPCGVVRVPVLDEYTFGQLFYFFEFSCYLSALLSGVDPFNQSGVEAYKSRMFARLHKPEQKPE